LGRAVIILWFQSIRLSAANGMLVLSAVKIIAAKKADRFFLVHIAWDFNVEVGMCQAVGPVGSGRNYGVVSENR
jgi:hypothetical protein